MLYAYDGGQAPPRKDWLAVAFRSARHGRAFGKALFLFDNKDADTGEKVVAKAGRT